MEKVSLVRQLILTSRLAVNDFRHEWWVCLCLVLTLASVLAPLLVLFGLRFGVVETLRSRLIDDPHNLEILPQATGHYDKAWFEAARRRDDVGFVIPSTRFIAATMYARSERAGKLAPRIIVELVPTAPGDPLLGKNIRQPHGLYEAVLSASAASQLVARPGDRIEATAERTSGGKRERAEVELTVTSVLDSGSFSRPALFVPVELLTAVEDYRDGFAVPAMGWPGMSPPARQRVFASFRMFANGLDAVQSVESWLDAQHIEVRTHSDSIATIKSMDHNLRIIFVIVAALGSGGFLLSLGASLWANVDRKRRDLSILRLLGWQTFGLITFPAIQGLIVAAGGTVLAVCLFLTAEAIINRYFVASLVGGGRVCFLLPEHYMAAAVLTLLGALLASAIGGFRAIQIQPGEGIRSV